MAEVVWTTPALDDFPYSGRLVPEFKEENIREVIYGSYRIIYMVRENTAYVTAVIHGSRDILRQLDSGDWDVT